MAYPQMTMDREAITRIARSLWEGARRITACDCTELYLKRASRRRASRDLIDGSIRISESLESGTAVRWSRHDESGSRHVAIGGMDPINLERALLTADGQPITLMAEIATGDHAGRSERLDCDADMELPGEPVLREWLGSSPGTHWIELGTTMEVLLGPEGWTAVRGRGRSSALGGDHGTRLIARRGFDILGTLQRHEKRGLREGQSGAKEHIILSPDAASRIALALVGRFHGVEPALGLGVGAGWVVLDDPWFEAGIAGGSFDDAGFPTSRRVLADGTHVVGGLRGMGTYWRRSYRDPPRSLPSTLIVGPGDSSRASGAVGGFTTCRVYPVRSGDWIVELGDRDIVRFRTSPTAMLEGCAGRDGGSELTADGVMTPGLVFEREVLG